MRQDSTGKIWQPAYFKTLQVNEYFHHGGNFWRKRSGRTAVMVRPEIYAGKWFYFKQSEAVERQFVPA